jgi:two-component system response regulator DesR
VIRIMVAEDMRILRETLVAVLSLEADIEVVAEVPTGGAIVPAAVECRPDVAVLDIDLPGVDGLTAAGQLHELLPDCRVLILTVLGRPAHLRKALAMHVSGFLVKDAPADELIAAVRRVAAGERVFDAELYGTVRNYLASAVTKLGARNRVDAVRIAADAGWL